jgi:hypothetical protein
MPCSLMYSSRRFPVNLTQPYQKEAKDLVQRLLSHRFQSRNKLQPHIAIPHGHLGKSMRTAYIVVNYTFIVEVFSIIDYKFDLMSSKCLFFVLVRRRRNGILQIFCFTLNLAVLEGYYK